MRAHACVVLISALAFNGLVYAQAYPSKPIRVIDAYAPGGSSDIIARTIGQRMVRERLSGLGAEPVGGTPEDFRAFISAETAKWATVVKASGMEMQSW